MAEPFKSLFTQGMVTHQTWQAGDGSWLSPDEVEQDGADWMRISDGSPATAGRIEKMSKSKKNVVDPDAIVDQYGADAVRWFMLSDSPPSAICCGPKPGSRAPGASSSACGGCRIGRCCAG